MEEDALNRMIDQDSFAGIDLLNRCPDPFAVMESYSRLVRRLYWQNKGLDGVVLIARAGIQHGLTLAGVNDDSDPDGSARLRSAAKGLAYDLASFTWPGWNESGIEISPLHLTIGLDAAKTNLRLARELNKGDLPLSRAHWMLAAHLLASGNVSAARSEFHQGAEMAQRAGATAEELLCLGFERLAASLESDEAAGADAELESLLSRLSALPNGPEFINQIRTATEVFRSSGAMR